MATGHSVAHRRNVSIAPFVLSPPAECCRRRRRHRSRRLKAIECETWQRNAINKQQRLKHAWLTTVDSIVCLVAVQHTLATRCGSIANV